MKLQKFSTIHIKKKYTLPNSFNNFINLSNSNLLNNKGTYPRIKMPPHSTVYLKNAEIKFFVENVRKHLLHCTLYSAFHCVLSLSNHKVTTDSAPEPEINVIGSWKTGYACSSFRKTVELVSGDQMKP